MASNFLGTIFKISTFGESHGPCIGVLIDGCPANLEISVQEIQKELNLRSPGHSLYTTSRKETDQAQILSGVFEGKTTGAPLAIIIKNEDANSKHYEPIKALLRPGHANYTYLEKYGCFDYRGGGRASARETAARVAAGAVAKKFLAHYQIVPIAYISSIGQEKLAEMPALTNLKEAVLKSPVFCPDENVSQKMGQTLLAIKEEKDSLGAVIEVVVENMLVGLGDPVYEKLSANLAKAMLSIPAAKGIEFGEGFQSAFMKGSEHNDPFILKNEEVKTQTNHSGGTLGGISNGMPLIFRVAFKPTSSIQKPQKTLNLAKESQEFSLPVGSRHDPCVAIRAVPVVEAMTALVLADALLLNRCAKL